MEKITYRQVGDFLIPNLEIPNQPTGEIGIWGKMRLDYLKEEKTLEHMMMITQGTLKQHLIDINIEAKERMDILMTQMMKAENITEELKAKDPIRWVQEVTNIQSRAREIILMEIIYQ